MKALDRWSVLVVMLVVAVVVTAGLFVDRPLRAADPHHRHDHRPAEEGVPAVTVLADALERVYSGATEQEAGALVDALEDLGCVRRTADGLTVIVLDRSDR